MIRAGTAWLTARSLLWTVLLPGAVTVYLPWRFFGLNQVRVDLWNLADLLALLVIALGAILLGACIVEFARSGRGTLAPMDPPKELVVQGLYRYVRNPMYLGVATILLGELVLEWSRSLLIYAAVWFVVVNLFVIGYEEPTLRRQFGESYDRYARSVGRWIPSSTAKPLD